MEKNVENFLKELSELTDKYGIKVDGCGCCGSPFLREVESDKLIEDSSIEYINEKKEYTTIPY